MIKLFVVYKDSFFFIKENFELFEKYNIKIVKKIKNADYVFYPINMGYNCYPEKFSHFWNESESFSIHREIRNINELIKLNKKLILYFRSDGAGDLENWINFLENKKNIIFFKDFNFNIDKFNDSIEVLQDVGTFLHHLKKIVDAFPEALKNTSYEIKKGIIDKKNFQFYKDNVKLFTFKFNAYGWISQNYCKNNDINNKPHDIFYVKHHRDTIDGYYRIKIKEKLENIKNLNKFMQSCDYTKYEEELCKSKIVISTYGLGECVFDDWKALLNNCVLLKSDTSYVKDYYGIYVPENEMIVYYKTDLSDLEEKINYILSNYEFYKKKAVTIKNYLLTRFSLENHIKDFSKMIRRM